MPAQQSFNPLWLIVIINFMAILWTAYTVYCGIRERRRHQVIQATADLIGAAQLIHLKSIDGLFSDKAREKQELKITGDNARSDFMAQEYRLLLLIEDNNPYYDKLKAASLALGKSAENIDYWGKHLKSFETEVRLYLKSQKDWLSR